MIDQILRANTGIDDLETPGYQHHDGLWFGENEHNSYRALAETIYNRYPFYQKILELGSGAGSLSYWLRQYNEFYDIITADGNKQIIHSPYIKEGYHFSIRTDENYCFQEDDKSLKFDLILSFEHLEHIQEDRLRKFLENVNFHSKKGTIFHGTASTLDYNARVHVTLKSKEFWDSKFGDFGWDVKEELPLIIQANKPFNFELQNTVQLAYVKQ